MRSLYLAAILAAACGGTESKPEPAPAPAAPTPPRPAPATPPDAAVEASPIRPQVPDEPAPAGYDFTPVAQGLFVLVACGPGEVPAAYTAFSPELRASHCAAVEKTQAAYAKKWLEVARPFIAKLVPPGLPKRVVYPFAGGDLSTALTVYPDADEITTLSLEPAGDPRALGALIRGPIAKAKPSGKTPALVKALATVRYELDFLYRVNFSNTMNMIDAMRGGALPTQLVFALSALKVHGYEVVSLRYFKLGDDGAIQYLTEVDVQKAPANARADLRNRIFANSELRFRKPSGRVQTYRHIQVNLDDPHLAKDPRVLRHLEAKGQVAGMTKAASYLLSWDSFQTIRKYLIANVVWMISDATGIAPKWGKPAGFEYETYGQFTGPHIGAGNQIFKNWAQEFSAQPRRELPFRFGYYDKKGANHLVVMRKKSV